MSHTPTVGSPKNPPSPRPALRRSAGRRRRHLLGRRGVDPGGAVGRPRRDPHPRRSPSSAQIDPNVIHGRPGSGTTHSGASRSARARSQSAPVAMPGRGRLDGGEPHVRVLAGPRRARPDRCPCCAAGGWCGRSGRRQRRSAPLRRPSTRSRRPRPGRPGRSAGPRRAAPGRGRRRRPPRCPARARPASRMRPGARRGSGSASRACSRTRRGRRSSRPSGRSSRRR